MQTQNTFIDDLKHQYKYGGVAIRLIFINVLVFIGIQIALVFGRLMDAELSVSEVLANLFTMQMDPKGFITHPWGILTSIFAHFGFMHIIFNMIFLYWAGRQYEELFGGKRLVHLYVLGGIAGGMAEFFAHLLFPGLDGSIGSIIGASGSIMAIFTAIAFAQPKRTIQLLFLPPIRLIWIGVAFILLDFIRLGNNDGTAHFAHLGGAILGLIAIQNIHSARNILNVSVGIETALKQLFKRDKKPKLKVKRGGNVQTMTDEEYNMNAKARQEETNRILDKISKSGYESLTKKEKDFLFNQSKNG